MPAARLRLRRAVIAASVSLGFATYAYAVPVNYQFTTGPVTGVSTFLGPNQAALDALSGLSVTGTFTYDSDVPQSGTTNGPIVFGQSDYAMVLPRSYMDLPLVQADSGLAQLRGLHSLKAVSIRFTKISDQAVRDFEAAIPGVHVYR